MSTSEQDQAQSGQEITKAVEIILRNIDEDPSRDGLQSTPQRFAKANQFLTEGYRMDLTSIINNAIFDAKTNELVLVRDINVASLSEHHLLPFMGKAHIGYFPSKEGKILGLSKLARIVEVFARRLQIQERLTTEVANAVQQAINADGVMVMMECEHMCMTMRGVQQVATKTVTLSTTGAFENDKVVCERFRAMLNGRG